MRRPVGRLVPVLLMVGSVLLVPGMVHADVYLTKTDSGTLMLSNERPGDTGSTPYRIILESKVPENSNLPNAETLKRIVRDASERYDVPVSLIYSIIEVESDGETMAESEDGAKGLMQLMPETARDMGVEDPHDPRQNVFGGTRYLRHVLNRFDGDLDLALAAYNAGPGTVEEHGGIPPYEQTKRFIEKVRNRFEHFKSKGDMVYTYRGEGGVLHVTNIH